MPSLKKISNQLKQLPNWAFAGIVMISLFLILPKCTFHSNQTIDFNVQVKPILNKNCIHCHGGVKQNGGFSMMTREKILAATESGNPAIIPGDPSGSEFIRRLTTEHIEERMPFEAMPLQEEEIAILSQWIEEGVEWGLHWAYKPVENLEIPQEEEVAIGTMSDPTNAKWGFNNIDKFVLIKLKEKGLAPSEMANKNAILRRLSLDLIGLPPPTNLAKKFLQKENPITYEALVDGLLANPHFGERWASMWLDLARYADSKGFERDPNRSIYLYRDYVIKAFGDDMPYDQFITEQLAGDLLPNPTDAQYIATGFHRNTPTNDEGGTDNEEYRVAAVIDRVNSTGQAILGSTFACIQCHGHPYDPFEHKEYYQLMAFLNNTQDMDTHKDYPLLRIYDEPNQFKLDSLIQWVKLVDKEERAKEMRTFLKTWSCAINGIETDSLKNAAFYDEKYLGFRQNGQVRMKHITLTGKNKLIVKGSTTVEGGRFIIRMDRADGEKIVDYALPQKKSWSSPFLEIPINASTGMHDLYLQYQNPSLTEPEKRFFNVDWFYFTKDFPGENDSEYLTNKQRFWDLMAASPEETTLIALENPKERLRSTKVFDRGNWQIHKEQVSPKVPEVLNPFPENAPENRLGLAQWITDKKNPLTARTMVNRLWEQLFGHGLVETLEDLGTQGTLPTHPKLLDWLAYHYMNEYGWSTKRLLKEMVLSATYRQNNKVTPALLELDPFNYFYTRGPRVRLSAEQIRDQTLAVSGLLDTKLYGKPVMPYQPEGIWSMPYSSEKWALSEGSNQHRRAIYTFIKRSAPYPSLETFDVAPRQVCISRRIRTNTPLQALVTLNDPVYMEAAKHFALRLQKEAGEEIEKQISRGYELAIGRNIPPNKLTVLKTLYAKALEDYQQDKKATNTLIGGLVKKEKLAETAALSVVTNAILNLDEYMMK